MKQNEAVAMVTSEVDLLIANLTSDLIRLFGSYDAIKNKSIH